MSRLGLGAGAYRWWVTLSRSPQTSNDDDGFFEPLDPPGAWAAIQPITSSTGRAIESVVELRWHPQISVDTRIVVEDPQQVAGRTTRELFVRGVQDLNEAHVVMRCLCEEIVK